MPFLCLAASLALPAAALAAPAAPASATLAGIWTGPNGVRLELKQEGEQVMGKLVDGGGPCPLPVGTEVLRGGVLDDSLGAEVRNCVLAPACGADDGKAMAILLVTKQLTGGVHSKAACAVDVKALVLRRPGAAAAMTAPPLAGRLSHTPAPPPRKDPPAGHTNIGSDGKLAGIPALAGDKSGKPDDATPPGQIPGRPVGGPPQEGYDPRDARQANTPRGLADKSMKRALALLGNGEFEKARKLFREALQKEPTRAEAYNGVGVSFYGRLDYDEALAWYKKALEADPRFGDAYYNMACVYALQGHKSLAFRYLRMAALNRYTQRQLLEEDPDLASLRGEKDMAEILEQMSADAKPSQPPGAARP